MPKLNSSELNDKMNLLLRDSEFSLSDVNVHPIGRDGNAFYMSARETVHSNGAKRVITALQGITIINSLPIMIMVYEGVGSSSSRNDLPSILQNALQSLLTEN